MAKRDYFQELQGIASQSLGPVNTNPITAEDEITKAKRKQLQEMTALANNMYPEDATSRFDFWKSKMNVNDLPQGVRKDYWKTYESMHPEGNDGAKRDFVDVTKRELGMIPGMSQKEFFLRERVTQTPDWARKELEPLLAEVSTTVANANYNKAQQVYVSDLNTRVNAFLSQQQLDPDVAIDDHVNDMLKLEQMNMMDMASVVNGRVGILKGGKQFVPAFGLNSSDQIMSDAAVNPSVQEQTVVQELARLPIKTAVADNVTSSRSTIATQERTSSTIARNWLEEGRYDMNNWDKAFSLMPDMEKETMLAMGLRGEITAGRIKDEKDLARAIYQTVDKYEAKGPPVTPPEPEVWNYEMPNIITQENILTWWYGKDTAQEQIEKAKTRQQEVDISDGVSLPDYNKKSKVVQVEEKDSPGASGTYNFKTDVITMSPFTFKSTYPDFSQGDKKKAYLTLLHESVHSIQKFLDEYSRSGQLLKGKPRLELPVGYLTGEVKRDEKLYMSLYDDAAKRNDKKMTDVYLELAVGAINSTPQETAEHLEYILSPYEWPAHTAEGKALYFKETKKLINKDSSDKEILDFYEWAAENSQGVSGVAWRYLLYIYKNPQAAPNQRDRLLNLMFEIPKQVAITKVKSKDTRLT